MKSVSLTGERPYPMSGNANFTGQTKEGLERTLESCEAPPGLRPFEGRGVLFGTPSTS